MKDFLWDFDLVEKDIRYDNQTYYRLIWVSALTMVLYSLLVLLGAFSTVGFYFSLIIVSLAILFNVSLSIYFLYSNRREMVVSKKSHSIVSLLDNFMIVDGVEISYSKVLCIVESHFKNVNPFNSSDMVDEGKFVYIFVKNTDLEELGILKSWKVKNVECLRIPLKYVSKEGELFVSSLKSLSEKNGIDFLTKNTSIGLGNVFIRVNKNAKNFNISDTNIPFDSCSSMEKMY